MTFFHETLHSQTSLLKPTFLSLGMALCLSVSVPEFAIASGDPLSDTCVEEKVAHKTHGYTPEVYDVLSKKSPLLPSHDTIQTQIDHNSKGNTFLQERAKKDYADLWNLVIAQQNQFLSDSGLVIFDTTVNKKSVRDLEVVSNDEWDNLKARDVSLPRDATELALTSEVKTSLSGVEERMLSDLATLIRDKRSQNNTNTLEHVDIKDLTASVYGHTQETKQKIDATITALLQGETYNTLYLLMWQRALLDVVEGDMNTIVEKSNAIRAGFKSRLGTQEKLNKASNTKEESAVYEKDLLDNSTSLDNLLKERKTLQQTLRDKMVSFAGLLKAPKDDTTPVEKEIYNAWLVDGDGTYGGYFSFLPSIASRGVVDAFYVNVLGARHTRAQDVEQTLNPLIAPSHVRQAFAAFKKHVIKNDMELEALLMGVDVKSFLERSHANFNLEHLFKMAEAPLTSSKHSPKAQTSHTSNDDSDLEESVEIQPLFSDLHLSDVDVGALATKAGKDIERILNSL